MSLIKHLKPCDRQELDLPAVHVSNAKIAAHEEILLSIRLYGSKRITFSIFLTIGKSKSAISKIEQLSPTGDKNIATFSIGPNVIERCCRPPHERRINQALPGMSRRESILGVPHFVSSRRNDQSAFLKSRYC